MKNFAFFIILVFCLPQKASCQISRATILANGNSYTDANYSWTATAANKWTAPPAFPANNKTQNCGGRIVCYASPSYGGAVITGTNWGMPYCWGGFSTISQHNSAMTASKSAGDICRPYYSTCRPGSPSNGAWPNCSSGLDCSGFVSRDWGVPQYSTTGLESISTPIKGWCVRQGDIYNDAGNHVRLASSTPSSSSVYTIEASTSTHARVERKSYTLSNYEMSGYIARVYNNNPSCGSAPSNLSLVTKTSNSITLTWSSSGTSSYEIYYKKSSETAYTILQMTVVAVPFTLSGLMPSTSYNIKISKVCTNGTWGISPTTLNASTNNLVGNDNEDRSTNMAVGKCIVTVNGFQISATAVTNDSEYVLANSLGQVICSGKAKDGTIECEVSALGIYFLSIVDRFGNRCTQKVLVR